MGVAALVLGIISIIIGFIPLCGSIAFIPAVIGLILGIVDTVQKSRKGEKKGVSIAGIVLSAIAVIIISLWLFVFGVAVSNIDVNSIDVNVIVDDLSRSLNEYYDANYDDNGNYYENVETNIEL